MFATTLLRDLAIVMTVAAGAILLCHWLKQPVVIGYLLAGLLIGPHTPRFSFVSDLDVIHTLAELGLVFLMFALGLEFNLPQLRKTGLRGAFAAVVEVTTMLLIGYGLGRLFGWNRVDSMFLASILAISSTTIIVKVFTDFKMLNEDFVRIVFAILILEDIAAVLILSVLTGLGEGGNGAGARQAVEAFLRISFFIVLFLLVGLSLVPRFMRRVARLRNKETLGIVTLGFCLGGSLVASWFGFSVALGAFLTGAVVAASNELGPIEDWVHPVRDMFSAIFFVSSGMLIQPSLLWEYKVPILIATAVALAGKIFSGTFGSLLAGYPLQTSFKVGVGLARLGEFSFVIASLGASLSLTSSFLYPVAISVAALTTFSTPYFIRHSDFLLGQMVALIPDRLQGVLFRYHEWAGLRKDPRAKSPQALILSKYVVRFIVYLVLLVAFLLIVRFASHLLYSLVTRRAVTFSLLWALAATLALPGMMAVSKYLNHVVLLWVTRGSSSRKPSFILRHINIRLFYSTLDAITLLGLTAAFLAVGRAVVPLSWMAMTAALPIAAWVVLGKQLRRATERLEKLLDEIFGLATSEPTRRAVLTAEKTTFLHGVTEPLTLLPDSAAAHASLRSLRLRELTGASIVAVYREGDHIANPSPDLELLPNDVLILMGTDEERAHAQKILL